MHENQYTVATFVIDGCEVTIKRPILTAEERSRTERNILSALNNFKEKRYAQNHQKALQEERKLHSL